MRLLVRLVGESGFEPLKSKTTDLQSAPFGHSGTLPKIRTVYNRPWSWWWDSNPRPADYKSAALPIELHQHILKFWWVLQGSNLWHPACKADALPAELNSRNNLFSLKYSGRDDRIRTCGPLVPNQMRYQTALHPDTRDIFKLSSDDLYIIPFFLIYFNAYF